MDLLAYIIAQASSALEAHPLLLAYGPMGAVLIYCMATATWFMKKVVAAFEAFGNKMEEGNREIIAKIHESNHRLQGLRFAQLLNTINVTNPSPVYRKMAEEELARASASANNQGTPRP